MPMTNPKKTYTFLRQDRRNKENQFVLPIDLTGPSGVGLGPS